MNRLLKKLWYLRDSYGIVGVKGGTEVEDMSVEELTVLRKVSQDIAPMMVKIGGPEARNDIRQCLNINVDGILAPMIETEYSFKNFVESLKSIAGKNIQNLTVAINLETITGYYNLSTMLNHPYFEYIDQVTVGRSDLAGSMDLDVNHKEVTTITSDIVRRVKEKGKMTSVGGKIDAISAKLISNEIEPDKINTRHVSIDIKKCKNLTFGVCEALSFEIELYKLLMTIDANKEKAYQNRIEDTKRRMERRETSAIPVMGYK